MYKKKTDGGFLVQSRSKPEKWYNVNESITTCDCPKFKYILKGQGECHHISEVKGNESQISTPLFDFGSYKIPLSLDSFCEKYGDNTYQALIKSGQICLHRGKVRRLI